MYTYGLHPVFTFNSKAMFIKKKNLYGRLCLLKKLKEAETFASEKVEVV